MGSSIGCETHFAPIVRQLRLEANDAELAAVLSEMASLGLEQTDTIGRLLRLSEGQLGGLRAAALSQMIKAGYRGMASRFYDALVARGLATSGALAAQARRSGLEP